MNICIIPARHGSKRVPKKNFREINGIPVINIVIETVFSTGLFDKVIVTTDSKEAISSINKSRFSKNISIHWRSEFAATDNATLADVLRDVSSIHKFNEWDNILLILPTSALVTNESIVSSCNFENKLIYNCVPVVRSFQPASRALKLSSSGKLEFLFEKNSLIRTQDCEDTFFDSGQFYWINYRCFLGEGALISKNALPFILDRNEVQDVDTEDDWKQLVLMYNRR